jgi:hypothetical protein
MPDFEITSPDGQKYVVTGPEGSTEQQALAHLQSQLGASSAPAVGIGEDLAKTALPSVARAGISTLGMPGDVGELVSKGADALGVPEWLKTPLAAAGGVIPFAGALRGPTSEQITQKVEGVTGPLYKPQTGVGQAFDTAAQLAPALLGGPETLGVKALTRVAAPTAAIEATRQFTDNPYAQAGAGVLGSIAAHRIAKPPLAAPRLTPEQVVEAGVEKLRSPEITAVKLKSHPIEQLANSAAGDLRREKLNPTLAPGTHSLVEELKIPINKVNGVPIHDLESIDTVRRRLSKIAGNPLAGEDQAAATLVIKKIDKYVENLPQSHLLAGNAKAAVGALLEGRADYAHGMSAGRIAERIRNADLQNNSTHSQGNFTNAAKQKFRGLLTSKKQGRGLTPEDLQGVEAMIGGSRAGNAVSGVAKLFGGGGGLGMLTGSAVGGLFGGPVAAAALPAGAYALRRVGDAITRRNANKILKNIIDRSPEAKKWAAIQKRLNAKNPRGLTASQTGLLSGAFSPAFRGLLPLGQ